MAHIVAEIPQFKIKYKDVFSLRNLYIMMHEMLLEEGWWGWTETEGTPGSDLHADIETLYSVNNFQKGVHSGGTEYWIWWRSKRGSSIGKPHGYFQDLLDIDFHGAWLQDIEVIHQGKKIKVVTGEMELFFRARVEADYNNTWKDHKILKHFQDVYEKRIMAQDIEKREKELWRDVYRISSKIKTFLNLRNFVPATPSFHPTLYGMEQ
jgi:hypothetical protein